MVTIAIFVTTGTMRVPYCIFTGGDMWSKWGKGSMACEACLKERMPGLFAFECKGKAFYYDWIWIYRWKNPHGGHEFFFPG